MHTSTKYTRNQKSLQSTQEKMSLTESLLCTHTQLTQVYFTIILQKRAYFISNGNMSVYFIPTSFPSLYKNQTYFCSFIKYTYISRILGIRIDQRKQNHRGEVPGRHRQSEDERRRMEIDATLYSNNYTTVSPHLRNKKSALLSFPHIFYPVRFSARVKESKESQKWTLRSFSLYTLTTSGHKRKKLLRKKYII